MTIFEGRVNVLIHKDNTWKLYCIPYIFIKHKTRNIFIKLQRKCTLSHWSGHNLIIMGNIFSSNDIIYLVKELLSIGWDSELIAFVCITVDSHYTTVCKPNTREKQMKRELFSLSLHIYVGIWIFLFFLFYSPLLFSYEITVILNL